MSTIFVARHGETHWNVEGRMQGRSGGDLTARGFEQAAALGEFARSAGIRRVVASPLPRAMTTAKLVAEPIGAEILAVQDLMEIDFGQCSGLREVEIDERFPGLREARNAAKWRHRWPGGESYADALERVERFLRAGSLRTAAVPTLIIAHQSVNRVVSHVLGEATESEVLAMTQPSDVVLRFEARAQISHARLTLDGGPATWVSGLYRGGRANLN